jgi:pimeloyl-ACP methyl ester carboxylesterase
MSTDTHTTDQQTVAVWGDKVQLRVNVAGSGDPILYFHPAAGFHWDPFLLELSSGHTVYAPEVPGTSMGDPHAIHAVDDLDDLVLLYEEMIRKLDLSQAPVAIGQSFGGMLALELAARYPGIFSRVVVLDSLGLWRDDMPVASYMEAGPMDLPGLLFADPQGPAAAAMFTPPPDPEQAIAMQAGLVWGMGCTGKFVWPIPDKGLRKRLHRVDVPTLIVWGEQDRLVPVGYAQEFGDLIAGSRVEIIADAGHIPQMEQTERTLSVVRAFLDGG